MVNARGPHCIGIFKIGVFGLVEAGATGARQSYRARWIFNSMVGSCGASKAEGSALLTNWLRRECRARVGTERKDTSEVSGNADHEVLPDKAGRDEVDVVGILKYERL